jgi:hypothetical protein
MRVGHVVWSVVGTCSLCGGPQSATALREPGEELLPLRPTDHVNPCIRCYLTTKGAVERAEIARAVARRRT